MSFTEFLEELKDACTDIEKERAKAEARARMKKHGKR